MYCVCCKELLNDKPVRNLEGYEHPYDFQLCGECRTSDVMDDSEVSLVVEVKGGRK